MTTAGSKPAFQKPKAINASAKPRAVRLMSFASASMPPAARLILKRDKSMGEV